MQDSNGEEMAVFLAALSAEARNLAIAVDQLVHLVDPTVVRVTWPQQRTIGYGIGPRKMSEHYAYIDCYHKHINLGFNRGALLPDPESILHGTGKLYRRVPVRDVSDVRSPALEDLLRAARIERVEALGR